MANEWTTEYPTQPGFYWLRNYCVQYKGHPPGPTVPGPEIVGVEDGLDDIYWVGDEMGLQRRHIVSAEWFGPIQPPAEHRPGAVPCVRCAWCEKVTDQLIAWTAQGADGFYHGAVVCRECYDRKFPQPPQENDIAPLIDAAVHILTCPPPPLPALPPGAPHNPGVGMVEPILYSQTQENDK